MSQPELPEGWAYSAIADSCVVNPRTFLEPMGPDCPVSFVPMAAVEAKTGRIDLSQVRPYGEVSKGYTRFSEGDVLFAKITPCMENGKIAIAKGLTNGHGCGSTEFHVLRPHEGLSRDFLNYFLLKDEFRKDAQRNLAGTAGQLRVSAAWLSEAPLPLPPLAEQRRLVAEIETQFTRLDASVAALRRAQANLKRYRASVLKDACKGRLVPTEAELARSESREYEPAAVLLERILAERRVRWESQEKRRGKYKEPSAPDTSALRQLPEGWVWATASQVASSMLGKMLDKKKTAGKHLPYLRNLNVRWDSFDLRDLTTMPFVKTELDRYGLLPGDVLVAEGGEPGRAAVWNGDEKPIKYQKALHRVRLSHGVVPRWLVLRLWSAAQTGTLDNYFTGSTIKHFTGESFERFPIPLPPLAEQARIVAEVERRLSVVQQAEATVEASLARADRLRQSILKQAFSGRLVPQDPNDEPASVLLERIRAEREAEAQAAAALKGKATRRGKRKATA